MSKRTSHIMFYRADVRFVRTSTDVIRTSTHVRVYSADGFLLSAPTVKTASVRTRQRVPAGLGPRGRTRTRVARTLVRTDSALGGQLGFCVKKGELSPFSLTSNQSRLNNWGLKRCVHTSFFPDQIASFLVGTPPQMGGGGFFVLQVFKSCWFEDVGPRGFLGGPKGQINFKE
jgi:hypothetical protein